MSSSPALAILRGVCPEGWAVVLLSQVAFFQEGPGILAKDFRETGVPLLRLKSIEGDYATLEGCNFLDPEMVSKKWKHFRAEVGDLLISTSASLGRVSTVTEESAGGIPYTGIIRFRSNSPDLDQGYLKAFLGSSVFVEQAESMATGSVIRHFGPSHIKQMAILLPPIDQQKRIGEFDALLSERLRLIIQENESLENISKTLFRSWFIGFDPVRAKSEGREPEGMSADIAALFPSEFVDSELGPIPKGWIVRSLDEIANFLNGLAMQKYPAAGDDSLPVIKIAQLRKGDTIGADLASSKISPEYIVDDGDVLFSWSGTLEVDVWTGGKGGLNQHLFKVTSSTYPKWFYYLAVKHHLAGFREIAANKATTMGHIQRRHLAEAKIAVPQEEVVVGLGEVMTPLVERSLLAKLHAKNLAETRDLLLPRLLSGAINVPT